MLARLATIFCTLMLAAGAGWAQGDDITIVKPARESNPSLRIAAFRGPKSILDQLRSDLTFSDWWRVVEAPAADYSLEVVAEIAGRECTVTASLADAAGNRVAAVTASLVADDYGPLVHGIVDALIQKTFGVPGPCSSRIAYVHSDGKTKEVYLSDFDGSRATRLTHNRGLSVEPAWGPRRRYLVYTLYESLSTSIMVSDLAQKRHRRLIGTSGLNSGAAFSPSGEHIAVTLSRGGVVDLYLANVANGQLTRLTDDRFAEASPAWSPDGKTICFVSDGYTVGGSPTLAMVSAVGGRPQRLLAPAAPNDPFSDEAVSPTWSPVSNRLCFSVRAGGEYALATIDLKTNDRKPKLVLSAAGDWESPSWLPDGRHVVCSRKLGGTQYLYIVDTWYGTARQLRGTGAGASLPDCSPSF